MFCLIYTKLELSHHNMDHIIDRVYGPYESIELPQKILLLTNKYGVKPTIHELLDIY